MRNGEEEVTDQATDPRWWNADKAILSYIGETLAEFADHNPAFGPGGEVPGEVPPEEWNCQLRELASTFSSIDPWDLHKDDVQDRFRDAWQELGDLIGALWS